MSLQKKKFEIRAEGSRDGRKFSYFTGSETDSKYLLALCKGTHIFQIELQPKLAEIRHLENEERRRYKEKYVYSDSRDLQEHRPSFRKRSLRTGAPPTPDNRISVISNTSSNTTSGVVSCSDRMHYSFDSEGEQCGQDCMLHSFCA